MNFFTYLGIRPADFVESYLKTGLVQMQTHNEFPLAIYCYGRKAVFTNHWDSVTSKCRGIIVNQTNDEIVARPFEKFHNHGSPMAAQGGDNTYNGVTEAMIKTPPVIWEKLDGFMCTQYRWQGVDYIASKGSFHSPHAKWATAQLRKKWGSTIPFLNDKTTLVFEGLCRDLRIVVDYADREELVLLAVVDIETGKEYGPGALHTFGRATHFATPMDWNLTLDQARKYTMDTARSLASEEGYVLTWYRHDPQGPPVRLKMKFVEYLRLHRMVCGVSPWRIWEALSKGGTEINDWLDKQNSTPWFEKFVQKWVKALRTAYSDHLSGAMLRYESVIQTVGVRPSRETSRLHGIRKAFAQEFNKPENKEFSPVLFKMLDKQDPSPAIWKQVEGMTKGITPCRDAQFS